MARKPIADDAIDRKFRISNSLWKRFGEWCKKVAGIGRAQILRMWIDVSLALEEQVRLLVHLAEAENVEADVVVLRWINWGYQQELREIGVSSPGTAGIPPAGEGGIDMPDPEAREGLQLLRTEFEEEKRANQEFRDEVLSRLDRIGATGPDKTSRRSPAKKKTRRKPKS